jgi:hypothetical protein
MSLSRKFNINLHVTHECIHKHFGKFCAFQWHHNCMLYFMYCYDAIQEAIRDCVVRHVMSNIILLCYCINNNVYFLLSLWKWELCSVPQHGSIIICHIMNQFVKQNINFLHDIRIHITYSSHWLIVPPHNSHNKSPPHSPTQQTIIVPVYTVQFIAYLYEVCVCAVGTCSLYTKASHVVSTSICWLLRLRRCALPWLNTWN